MKTEENCTKQFCDSVFHFSNINIQRAHTISSTSYSRVLLIMSDDNLARFFKYFCIQRFDSRIQEVGF